MFKAIINVTLRPSVLDPQGVAVKGSLHTLGFADVNEVRIGKRIEVKLDATDRATAEIQVKEMSEKVLSNPVIENFTFELEEVL